MKAANTHCRGGKKAGKLHFLVLEETVLRQKCFDFSRRLRLRAHFSHTDRRQLKKIFSLTLFHRLLLNCPQWHRNFKWPGETNVWGFSSWKFLCGGKKSKFDRLPSRLVPFFSGEHVLNLPLLRPNPLQLGKYFTVYPPLRHKRLERCSWRWLTTVADQGAGVTVFRRRK